MTLEQKADSLLKLREKLYSLHFSESDRKCLIDAMVDFAENNKSSKVAENTSFDNPPKEVKKEGFGEISDEEVEKASNYMDKTSKYFFQYGAKWYREQLKKKSL